MKDSDLFAFRSIATGAALVLVLLGSPVGADCRRPDPGSPRTLVLALDGIPLRVVEEARRRGAFEGWPTTRPLVSTFPSMTNVAFTAMLQPFGARPAEGYEVQYFDRQRNKVVGRSPFRYHNRVFGWRDLFDRTGRSFVGKIAIYGRPIGLARREIEAGAEVLLDSPKEVILVHVGGTDALVHTKGDETAVRFLIELDDRLKALKAEHEERRGRPLRVVLLSDHGNTRKKVRRATGIRRQLENAGLRLRGSLERPNDVVAATFGVVSYGALFLKPERAETAGRAVARSPAVEVVSWIAGEREVRVISRRGEATIHWLDLPGGRHFAYRSTGPEPLGFASVRSDLEESGLLTPEGFGSAADWFAAGFGTEYPGALRRLVDGLTASYVANRATVLFSLEPGYAWGWKSALLAARLKGGRLEGTHGGLDRESSLAFFLSDDPTLGNGVPLHVAEALAQLAIVEGCEPETLVTGTEGGG